MRESRVLEGSSGSPPSTRSAAPRCGCRRTGERGASLLWEPTGPAELRQAPRQRQRAAGEGNSIPGPARASTLAHRRPGGAAVSPASLSLPVALVDTWCHPLTCASGSSKERPGASPDLWKAENQGPQAPPSSGNGSSLVSPSLRGWSLDGCASGKGLAMA